jgi:multiple antibiotic resistance protein
MEYFSFTFTVFFMLLGPKMLIGSFAELMKGADVRLKRDVAIRGTVIAAALCAFVTLTAGMFLSKYRISIDAVRIAGGLVLLTSSLLAIFHKGHSSDPLSGTPTALQIATSPVAVPMIVPPAGIAALLMFAAFAPHIPGLAQAIAISLAIIMVMNFLVMYFIDLIMKTPGLKLFLILLGSVLVFMQAALAIQMILTALKSLGIIQV